jgi:hypothetical protein
MLMLSSGGGFLLFIYLAILITVIAGGWMVYTKAERPGWAVLIPIYNVYVLCKIVGRPGWWVILLFIPIVGIVIDIILALDLAKSFRKGSGFTIGLIFLPFIFVPILGFGDATYAGPSA